MTKNRLSQSELILHHLKSGFSLTQMESLVLFQCFRLGARIYDLRQAGWDIKTENVTENEKTYAKYRLVAD